MSELLFLLGCLAASAWFIYALGKTWDGTWPWLANFMLGRKR